MPYPDPYTQAAFDRAFGTEAHDALIAASEEARDHALAEARKAVKIATDAIEALRGLGLDLEATPISDALPGLQDLAAWDVLAFAAGVEDGVVEGGV